MDPEAERLRKRMTELDQQRQEDAQMNDKAHQAAQKAREANARVIHLPTPVKPERYESRDFSPLEPERTPPPFYSFVIGVLIWTLVVEVLTR